jgi:hypothetical protein
MNIWCTVEPPTLALYSHAVSTSGALLFRKERFNELCAFGGFYRCCWYPGPWALPLFDFLCVCGSCEGSHCVSAWRWRLRHDTRMTLYLIHCTVYMGRDSSVGIETDYELDGRGIESRWGASLSAPVQTGPGAHLAPIHWVPGLSRG